MSQKKSIFLLTEEELLAEAGEANIPENPPDRKATRQETQAAAEVAVFLEDDLGVDTRRLFIQVRDGHLYIQGSVESLELKKEIEEIFESQKGFKSFESQLSVQKSAEDF